MTVTYTLSVHSADFAGFGKLLFRWKGGIYRLVYREFLIFILCYYLVLVVYRFALNDPQQRSFEYWAEYCRDFLNLIPITFAMGFYINIVIQRWWDQYMNLPWVDRVCVLISTYVTGATTHARLVRRNLARYLSLMSVLTLTIVSPTVKRRFKELKDIVDSGILTDEEKVLLESLPHAHGNWYYPALWFGQLAMRARKENLILNDNHLAALLQELNNYRSNCGMLLSYDWVSIPLVYTQVVSIAVYFFFAGSIFGRQALLHEDDTTVHKYVPVFTFLQFIFYMGWLKCAEQLINPLGDDDEDFEIDYLIDRNLEVGFAMVDDLTLQKPKLIEDRFFKEKMQGKVIGLFDDSLSEEQPKEDQTNLGENQSRRNTTFVPRERSLSLTDSERSQQWRTRSFNSYRCSRKPFTII